MGVYFHSIPDEMITADLSDDAQYDLSDEVLDEITIYLDQHFLGRITRQEYRILWRVWECIELVGSKTPYSDYYVRFYSQEVRQLFECCRSCYEAAIEETGVQNPPVYRKLLDILEPAVSEGLGLVSQWE